MNLLKSSKLLFLTGTVGLFGQALYAQGGAYPAVPAPAAPGTARPHVWISGGPLAGSDISPNLVSFCVGVHSWFCPADLRKYYATDFIANANGGSGMNVYIVDAYDLPSAAFDVATFSTATGLPQLDGVGDHGTFTKLTPFGLPPSGVPFGWSIEEALDIEWAHAMAPKANIFLVEALSSSYFDLINAEGVAVAAADVTSNSWGSGEFASEVTIDPTFAASHSPVLFSTGDGGAPGGYPAYSPYVVAVGGTSNFRNAMGYRSSETGWSGSGGGISVFEPEPPYQAVVQGTGSRTIPDVGLIADPATPVIIYSFDDGGYFTVGGTSVACPVFAGFLANVDGARVFAGKVKLGPAFGVLNPELYTIGTSSLYHYSFFDIIVGSNGFPAGPGYDLVTGFGDPLEPALSYRLVTLIP